MATRAQKPKRNTIRANTGVLKIEVNDDGEYITINTADQDFAVRLMDTMEEFESELPKMTSEIAALDKTGMDDKTKFREALRLTAGISRVFGEKVDTIFGPNTCVKVFGTPAPSVECFGEFFEQLMPYIQKSADERQKAIKAKYSAARKGNV